MSKKSPCLSVKGEPKLKKRFELQAAAMDFASWASRRFRQRYHAYRCDRCQWWHIGRPSKRTVRATTLFLEVGPRAAHNMEAENVGQDAHRLAVLARRGRRA